MAVGTSRVIESAKTSPLNQREDPDLYTPCRKAGDSALLDN